MRAILLRAALVAGVALLLFVPLALAQDSDPSVTATAAGSERAGAAAPAACGRYSTTPEAAGHAYLPVSCVPESDPTAPVGCVGHTGSSAARCVNSSRYYQCDSPYAGYGGLPAGSDSPQTRYISSQSSPYFAPGGEAYSYAGYGGFSPYGYGQETSVPGDDMAANGMGTTAGVPPSVAGGWPRVCP
jgi:hypothetical protein